MGRGALSWDRSRAPVLTVHRGEGVCFAVHIHGEAEEREQRGRRRRVASQTQLQDLRRKGRDGGGGEGEWAPGCDPALESWGRCAALPAGTPPGPVGARNRSGRNFPPSGRGAGRSAERPRGGRPNRGDLGAHGARGSCGQG